MYQDLTSHSYWSSQSSSEEGERRENPTRKRKRAETEELRD